MPENAERLMRSRYSAYVLGETGYLAASWHPDYRPDALEIDPRIRWIGLEILNVVQQAQRARVEFEARLLLAGRVEALHENSAFVRADGRWWYTRGDILPPTFAPFKPGRNQDCPCGSGNKFKRCCAR